MKRNYVIEINSFPKGWVGVDFFNVAFTLCSSIVELEVQFENICLQISPHCLGGNNLNVLVLVLRHPQVTPFYISCQ